MSLSSILIPFGTFVVGWLLDFKKNDIKLVLKKWKLARDIESKKRLQCTYKLHDIYRPDDPPYIIQSKLDIETCVNDWFIEHAAERRRDGCDGVFLLTAYRHLPMNNNDLRTRVIGWLSYQIIASKLMEKREFDNTHDKMECYRDHIKRQKNSFNKNLTKYINLNEEHCINNSTGIYNMNMASFIDNRRENYADEKSHELSLRITAGEFDTEKH